jgi:glycosyltransferase involved in cell wall biosynthesis
MSNDRTQTIIESNLDIINLYKREPDSGLYDGLRKGFLHSSGEIIGWINSDDMLMPWTLKIVREIFERNPHIEWITGIPSMIDKDGRMLWVAPIAPRYIRSLIKYRFYSGRGLGPIQQESCFFRRSLYERAGGINPGYRLAGDFDLWCRFANYADLVQMGTVLASFRLHDKNLSNSIDQYYDEGKARSIVGGKFIGSLISYFLFLISRIRGEFRVKDLF